MNVVGRVGSLITQGVYSVATPFHPFGGAVDIIVVQQQNGSYRSTPWYVRFGKFQGVLKGAEKIVKIEVNGSEANFHMNLDNSGEAYFTKEEPYDKDNEKSEGQDNSDSLEGLNEGNDNDFASEAGSRKDSDRGRHRYSASGEDEFEMRDERVTLGMDRLERTDSDAAIFYDFQDVQFSLDTSDEPSECNSSQSDNLDDRVHVLGSHGNSEVILVSIDGHILTAPIKSAEKNGEILNLNTPDFHLGPGKVSDLKNNSTEFSPGEDVGTTEYVGAQNICPNGFTSQDSEDEHKECVNIIRENKSGRITRGEVATSCLELTELENHIENVNNLKKDSSADSSKHHENMKEGCLSSPRAICEHGNAQLLSGSDTYSSVATPALSVADADADATFEKTPLDSHNDTPDNIPNQLDNLDSKPEEHNQLLAEGDSAESNELVVNDSILVENEILENGETDSGMSLTPSGRRWRLWSMPFRRQSNEEVFVDSESVSQVLTPEQSPTKSFTESPPKQYVRTNVPTSDQIESLNLKEGQNIVTFIFSTRVLGLQKVDAHIYLWKHNARIVISDVDGTITKSDVLGQFMPLVGKDWTHSGIAHLFSAIKENGYQLLFLSARAIVQAYLTKTFLFNLKQDGKSLPSGPVVISPDGLFPSLYREVIRRAPHEFKIACLEDIKALFPPDHNPFYAGFGNRNTDELSYRKIGIPMGKIFIINPKGEVAINNRVDVKSYTSLHTLVHDMFPPTSSTGQEDYNSWNYWKMPLMDLGDL